MFLNIFCNQMCLETGKSLENIDFSRDLVVFLFQDTEYGKCLETGKQHDPLLAKKRDKQGAPNDLLDV